MLLFFVYIILGLYAINYRSQFIAIPESLFNLHGWIILIGGAALLYSGLRYLSRPREAIYR